MSKVKQITERVAAPFTGTKVNREAGYIDDVLICGFTSENGREYPWGKGLQHKPGTYEGKVVNCDHGKESTIDRRLGWLSNETTGADGRPRARLNVLNSHPMANRVYEAAERNPSLFGLSHVAVCATTYANQRERIDEIRQVISVDLVADPATTKGLHESKDHTMPRTIKKLLEDMASKANVDQLIKLRRLTEMDDSYADMPVEVAADATPEDGITEAFKAAIMSVVDGALSGDTDPKEALGKIKKLLVSHGDVNGDGKVDEEDVEDLDKPKDESKKPSQGKAILEALDVAGKLKFKADKTDLEIIASAPAASREQVAKRLMGTANESRGSGPKSYGRVNESKGGDADEKALTEATKPLNW